MNLTLSPALSRILALALTIALAGAVYSIAVAPVLDAHRGYGETIERSRELVGRYGRTSATREPLERQLAELRKRSQSASGTLQGKSPTLAAAQLQNRVKKIVTRNGGSIRSLQTLPPQQERDLERITIRIQMTARIEQFQKILYAFETDATFLFLDDVNIRHQKVRRARRRRAKPVKDERLLTVRMNLYGFARREGS